MRDYFNVPETLLLDRDVSAFDIIELAINHINYKSYMDKLEEKERARQKNK